jgi:hydrogenase-4 component F
MELVAVLAIPAVASCLVLLPALARLAAVVTLLASGLSLALATRIAGAVVRSGPQTALGGYLDCDALGALVLLLVAFVGTTASLYSAGYLGARDHGERRLERRRYYPLYNLFLLSMLAVPIIGHIALMWIAVSLTTLLSAFLVGYDDTPEALEAAWKYVVLTTLGAILALLGILILYWASDIAGSGPFSWAGLLAAAPHMPPALLWTGFLLVLVGFGTKAGLVPMHTWLPDAHSQAPASICALLSGVETTTVLYAILRLFPALEAGGLVQARSWFIVFGLISVGAAALLLIHVRDYKRMFAFSTVEHMGIILVAVGLGGGAAHLGAAYQITAHALAKSFCFYAAGVAVLAVGTQEIAAVRGLMQSSPGAALALLLGGLAIAGAPPFAVFVSEFAIFKAGLAAGHYWTIGLLALFVVVAFCGILLQISRMLFGAPPEPSVTAGAAPATCRVTLLLAAIPMIVLGLFVPAAFQGLLSAAAAALGS